MLINSTRNMSVLRKATLALVALSFFQPAVGARQTDVLVVEGTSVGIGVALGDMVRFTAFNPRETESGRRNETISVRLTLFIEDGTSIAESATVEIPPGEFRSIDFYRAEMLVAGEPRTGRLQVRAAPLWGLRSRAGILISTSLEIVDSSTGQSRINHTEFKILKLRDAPTPK